MGFLGRREVSEVWYGFWWYGVAGKWWFVGDRCGWLVQVAFG